MDDMVSLRETGLHEGSQCTLENKEGGTCAVIGKSYMPHKSIPIAHHTTPHAVGWLPVSSARSRACGGAGGCGGGGRHVKVRKEGAAIRRKVDLCLHGCYRELLSTLALMFPATTGGDQAADCLGSAAEKQDAGLVVTYEDADGDWMLLGDVPWEDFARSVKRLKILL